MTLKANRYPLRLNLQTWNKPGSVSDAAVLQDLPGRRKSLGTAATITLDPPSAHPGQVEAGRGREFYLRMATSQKWSSRELERQINGALFERVIMSPVKVAALLRQLHPDAACTNLPPTLG